MWLVEDKEDDCYMTAANFNGVYIVGKRKPDADKSSTVDAKRIAEAKKNIEQYEKR